VKVVILCSKVFFVVPSDWMMFVSKSWIAVLFFDALWELFVFISWMSIFVSFHKDVIFYLSRWRNMLACFVTKLNLMSSIKKIIGFIIHVREEELYFSLNSSNSDKITFRRQVESYHFISSADVISSSLSSSSEHSFMMDDWLHRLWINYEHENLINDVSFYLI
jgi:hypothetical protein